MRICARCHPPAAIVLVARWIDDHFEEGHLDA